MHRRRHTVVNTAPGIANSELRPRIRMTATGQTTPKTKDIDLLNVTMPATDFKAGYMSTRIDMKKFSPYAKFRG